MQHLTKLFKLIELTRSHPQTGYMASGVFKHELSDLASHHYLVTFIAWQVARNIIRAGAKIDLAKVLEYALIHDLGEILGGDISMHYGKINPRARKAAKNFEAENQKFLAKFFGKDKNYTRKLMQEILDAKSDEALVAKLADYLETAHYLFLIDRGQPKIIGINSEKLEKLVKKIKDKVARAELSKFVKTWQKELTQTDTLDILYGR